MVKLNLFPSFISVKIYQQESTVWHGKLCVGRCIYKISGQCDSFVTLSHPIDLDSQAENCACCEANIVIQWGAVVYCG